MGSIHAWDVEQENANRLLVDFPDRRSAPEPQKEVYVQAKEIYCDRGSTADEVVVVDKGREALAGSRYGVL